MKTIKANYLNILFYILAAILIGILKGFEVLILLILFIVLFGLILSTMTSGYYALTGIKGKKLPLTATGALVVSSIIYIGFGKLVLVKTLSYSLVVATIVTLMIIHFTNRK